MQKKLAPGQSVIGDALIGVIEEVCSAYATLDRLWQRVRAGEPGAEEAYDRWIRGIADATENSQAGSRRG